MKLMAIEFRPLLAVLVSLVASVLIYVLGEHIRPNAREGITILASICKIVLVYSMIPAVIAGKFCLSVSWLRIPPIWAEAQAI